MTGERGDSRLRLSVLVFRDIFRAQVCVARGLPFQRVKSARQTACTTPIYATSLTFVALTFLAKIIPGVLAATYRSSTGRMHKRLLRSPRGGNPSHAGQDQFQDTSSVASGFRTLSRGLHRARNGGGRPAVGPGLPATPESKGS